MKRQRHMNSRHHIALLVLMATGLVGACSTPSGEEHMPLLAEQWEIRAVADAEGRLHEVIPDTSPYLQFTGSEVSGDTGCNSFSGTVEIGADGTITVGVLRTTLMGCDPLRSAQETDIHHALSVADGWAVEGTTAWLWAEGFTVMELSMASTTLPGSQWSVTSINNGHGGVQSVVATSHPTLMFDEGDHLSGSTGCNNMTATYQAGRETLAIGPVGTTRRLCATPSGIMEQEQNMINALANTTSYAITGDTLRLFDETGATQLLAIRQN